MCEPILAEFFGTFKYKVQKGHQTWMSMHKLDGAGKTEPMENWENWTNGKFASAIMYF